jgi:hypothetical protein
MSIQCNSCMELAMFTSGHSRSRRVQFTTEHVCTAQAWNSASGTMLNLDRSQVLRSRLSQGWKAALFRSRALS